MGADFQAVVALVNLDNARPPLKATLLRASNLLVQQAAENWDEPSATGRLCRFAPVGAGRRMCVNNAETCFVPREGWCVITVEAGAGNPIDLALATLGGDGNPRFGGGYWPGRVAEVVFVPREWQPDSETPPEPVAWDATVRNALESYLVYKHRFMIPRNTPFPAEYGITRAKVELVESVLNLPRVKIAGTLLMIR